MLEATTLDKRFGRTVAVSGFDLVATVGLCAVLGPNGAGKTTILRMLSTALVPDRGTLRIGGLDPSTHLRAVRELVGYLPQDYGLYPRFTVSDFLDYVALLRNIGDRRTRQQAVEYALELADLDRWADQRIGRLSGGTRRRVGLAAAVLGRPSVVLLDEPFVGLDPEQRVYCTTFLSAVSESSAVIVSTHQIDDVVSFFERVVVIDEGKLIYDGTPAGLLAHAAGRVWLGPTTDESLIARPAQGGLARHLGVEAPSGRDRLPETLEDGYLLLLTDRDRAR
jgi:ABC-2 type transport system ATP-binding protein